MDGRRKWGSIIGEERGTAILEMAVVLPLFLLVVFGIFEFGRAWLDLNTMNHATREAVRLAATTAGLTADNLAVHDKATSILEAANISGPTVTVTNTAPSGTPPEVSVTTSFTFRYATQIGPLLGFSFKGTIPLTSSATMRYER